MLRVISTDSCPDFDRTDTPQKAERIRRKVYDVRDPSRDKDLRDFDSRRDGNACDKQFDQRDLWVDKMRHDDKWRQHKVIADCHA